MRLKARVMSKIFLGTRTSYFIIRIRATSAGGISLKFSQLKGRRLTQFYGRMAKNVTQ
ncbi:MAG: hypothetical protein AAB217_22920 [Chloroflexota bacterium]